MFKTKLITSPQMALCALLMIGVSPAIHLKPKQKNVKTSYSPFYPCLLLIATQSMN